MAGGPVDLGRFRRHRTPCAGWPLCYHTATPLYLLPHCHTTLPTATLPHHHAAAMPQAQPTAESNGAFDMLLTCPPYGPVRCSASPCILLLEGMVTCMQW